jgi:hypothetical protein
LIVFSFVFSFTRKSVCPCLANRTTTLDELPNSATVFCLNTVIKTTLFAIAAFIAFALPYLATKKVAKDANPYVLTLLGVLLPSFVFAWFLAGGLYDFLCHKLISKCSKNSDYDDLASDNSDEKDQENGNTA